MGPLGEFLGEYVKVMIATLPMGPLGEVLKKPFLLGISANVLGVERSETN